MFLRMLRQSFIQGIRGKLLAVITVAFGASLTTAMLNVSLDIGDKINSELKAYGANIIIIPQTDTLPVEIDGVNFNPLADQAYIDEGALPRLKTIFWRNNILGFAPYLDIPANVRGYPRKVAVVGTWFDKELLLPTGEAIRTGVKKIKRYWDVEGEWIRDEGSLEEEGLYVAMIGRSLARELKVRPGEEIDISLNAQENTGGRERRVRLVVKGIMTTGGEEEGQIYVPLRLVQEVFGLPGRVGRVEVSALTTPENELARKAAQNPEALTPREFERWYCTAYISAIIYQIEEAIPGAQVKAVRQIAKSEGLILKKIQLLMALLTVAALVSSALGISSLMTTRVLERSKEIGLLKAIGAGDAALIAFFSIEVALIGIMAAGLGYGLGLGFAQFIAKNVFGSMLTIKLIVIPVVLVLSVLTSLLGSISPLKFVLRLRPAEVLHGT